MSDKPYLYVIRKKQDVLDLEKYLESIRGVGELNFLCKPKKCYNVRWAYGFFRYLKTDLVAALTVDRGDILESLREEAGIYRIPRTEPQAFGSGRTSDWKIIKSKYKSWQDYAYKHLANT